jgi:glycosyltransferase involved in cell wall biosynthesis
MKPLRVLVVGQTPPPYGGQTVMIQLLLEGVYQDIELCHVRMNFSRELKTTGHFRFSKLWELFRVVAAIYWTKIRKRPEVLYYPVASPDILPVLRDIFILSMTRWFFRATVLHFHAGGLCEYSLGLNPVLRRLFGFAFSRPDLVIRTAKGAAADGPALHCKRELVVSNGVPDCAGEDIERVGGTGSRINILFVALLWEEKGLFVAIQAVQQLLAAGMDLELTCLGEWRSPEVKRRVEAMIEPALRSRFHFPGVQTGDSKWEYFRNAHIFVFPSYVHAETFGLVLVEAMCFSLPIVTTRWRGIPDVVEEGVCAFLCEPQDVTGCRDALAQLIKDPFLRDSMGKAARERYLRYFTIEAHRKAMESTLSQLRG